MVTSESQSSVALAIAFPVMDGSTSVEHVSSNWTVAVSGQIIAMVGAVMSNVLMVWVQSSVVLVAIAINRRHREGPDKVVAALWVGVNTHQAAVKLQLIAVGVAHVEVLVTVVCGHPLNLTQSGEAGVNLRAPASVDQIGAIRAIQSQLWCCVVCHREHLVTSVRAAVSALVRDGYRPRTCETVGSYFFTTSIRRGPSTYEMSTAGFVIAIITVVCLCETIGLWAQVCKAIRVQSQVRIVWTGEGHLGATISNVGMYWMASSADTLPDSS